MSDQSWFDEEETGHLVRPYAITGGRTSHEGHAFNLITLVITRSPADLDTSHMEPEPAAILELCRDRAVAVAEIAARLDLPASVVKVLCGDLLEGSLILVRAPRPESEMPSVELIERVMNGIRRL